MKIFWVLAISTAILVSSIEAAFPQQASDQEVYGQLVGTWRMVSRIQRLEDGSTREDSRSLSYIIYTDTGHMCWVAMDPDRTQWASRSEPTEAELAAGFTELGAYCAVVTVNAEEGYLLHHVEIAKLPHAVGMARKRWFNFDGADTVSLRVDPHELSAPVVDDVLTWERVRN